MRKVYITPKSEMELLANGASIMDSIQVYHSSPAGDPGPHNDPSEVF